MTAALLVLDAPSMYFRAFFGVPDSVTAPDGTPINAVRGFLDMFATLVRTRRPDRAVCCLDEDWRPAWRVELLPSYKAHRVAHGDVEVVPDALEAQVPVLLEVLEALGVPAVGAAGYEADDVAGTLATREPAPVEVVSGDRDLFQLIDDAKPVRLLYIGRGVAKLEVYDDDALRQRYGVPASSYVDLAVLRGDPSDGLPGVSGIGEKTAASLIRMHGDLAGLLEAAERPAAGGMRPGIRAKLTAARDYLAVAPTVVRVVRDLPLPDMDTRLPVEPADPERLLDLAQRWNLSSAVNRVLNALNAARGARE